MNTRRALSEIMHVDPMGRPLDNQARRAALARALKNLIQDDETTPRQYHAWAEDIETGELDLGDVARWIDAIKTRKPAKPGAYFQACAKRKKTG